MCIEEQKNAKTDKEKKNLMQGISSQWEQEEEESDVTGNEKA